MKSRPKSRLRLKDRLAAPKKLKKRKQIEQVILTIDCMYAGSVQFVKSSDVLDVIEVLEKNGGSLKDLKKLLKK